jgi:hypothetical protein
MSPHQVLLINEFLEIWHGFSFSNILESFFAAPFDVRLIDKKKSKLDQEIYTVVQPDLCIICDDAKIDERGAIGVLIWL